MDIKKTFIGARMNKAVDERLVPNGEYTDALNIRISSDEDGEAGSVENAKGNERLTALKYNGANLINAKCIGEIADGSRETIYWFVTSDEVDMIVSYNTNNKALKYHVVSTTVLNFDEKYTINGVDIIDNLLFFTDNLNPPRRINVDSVYPQPVAGVDQITEDDISVIVKPPKDAPEIDLISSPGQNNYIEDKFIKFSYRYKYANGEYSALSEFSDLAFSPGQFRLDYTTYDMVGMRNIANQVNVSFNTGDKRVVGIDLCFKLSNSNVVNVISRFDKGDEGWPNDATKTVTFDNQKIYTTLQQSELLRLYDNVPRKAKSQTRLGNRLFYGNYVDGYNIDTTMDYEVNLISEEVGVSDASILLDAGADYAIDVPTSILESRLRLDLSGIELKAGGSLYINLNIQHDSFGGSVTYDTSFTNSYNVPFQFILPRDYFSVSDLANDPEFLAAIQLTDTVANAADGYSMSDLFYTAISVAADWQLVNGGVTALNQGFVVSNAGNLLSFHIPALQIEDTINPGTFAYEYFANSGSSSAVFIEENSRQSLHSNMDYEVGIVYMDDYKRASTVLVDSDNTVYVPANLSDNKNSIQVKINNKAPSWAKSYRLMMKPSKGGYETIYSNIFFYDQSQAAWWLKLEGDNQTKCNTGDTLYVKVDSSGPTNNVIRCKVLDKQTLQEDQITGVTHPSGLYIKIRNQGFNLSRGDQADYLPGQTTVQTGLFPDLMFPMFIDNPLAGQPGELDFKPLPIPSGSQVEIFFENTRNGSGDSCRPKRFVFDRSFTAAQDYDNIQDLIITQNIDLSVPTNEPAVESSGLTPTAEFSTVTGGTSDFFLSSNNKAIITNFTRESYVTKIGYYYDSTTGKAWLGFMNAAGSDCGGRPYYLNVEIKVFSGGGLLVFETEPDDVNTEIFFEGHKSYTISNRFHTGDIQNQDSTQPCIVNLDMYNCFSFGNGVESFKINDALSTPGFNIGERVSAVSEQDYKEAHRFADITYSGVYNEETNINNLNVFNLGLVNFRPLERLFGPINVLHGRQTDLLVLQEDKISYVLAGKNLLSDAAGGGVITSVPEVLGTQISRIEEYGISDDADSFDVFGYDIFFTDTKRGSVINLRGASSSSDELNVISRLGLRTWFRDQFIENHNNVKIGAYDPYNNEYVLHFSESKKIAEVDTLECGFSLSGTGDYNSSVINTSNAVGNIDVDYTVDDDAIIVISYNGVDVINESVLAGSGTLTFNKNLQDINNYSVSIETTGEWSVTFGCVESQPLTLVRVVSGDIVQEGLFTKQNHYWFNFNTSSSESTDDIVTMLEDPTSLITFEDGFESEGYFPAEGSTVVMKGYDTINRPYDPTTDKMLYLLSDTLYNSASDILPLATEIPSSFVYTNPTNLRYLYLVWRYTSASGGNEAPFAFNQLVNTEKNVAAPITLTGFDSDGDPLTFTVLTQPSHGVLSGTEPNLIYTPSLDYVGVDSFTFKVNDGTTDSNTATISINVVEPPANNFLSAFRSVGETSLDNGGSTCLLPADIACFVYAPTYDNDGVLVAGDKLLNTEDINDNVNGGNQWFKIIVDTIEVTYRVDPDGFLVELGSICAI